MLKVYVLLSLIAGAHLVVLPFSLRTTTEAGIDGEKPVRPNFGNNFAGLFGGALGGLRGGIRGDAGFGGQINVAENAIKNADAEPVSDAHSEYGVPEEEPHSEYGVPKALPAIEATTAHVCPEADIIPQFVEAPAAPDFFPLPVPEIPEAAKIDEPKGPYPARIEEPIVTYAPYPARGVPDLRGLQGGLIAPSGRLIGWN